jgi:hypothetical protein
MQSEANAMAQWHVKRISLPAVVALARLQGGAAIRLHPECLGAGKGRARALRSPAAVGLLCAPLKLPESALSEGKNASPALWRKANAKPALRGQVGGSTGLRPVLQVLERWSRVKMHRMPSLAPNQSFERTSFSWLHQAVLYAASRSQLKAAAQLQR